MIPNDRYEIRLAEYLLRLGDNCLIFSQRLCGWFGLGPTLDEELALANIALAYHGHARLWLEYAGGLYPVARTEDDLAGLRAPHEFRNVLLVEQPNMDFADIQTRLFLFGTWYELLLAALTNSRDKRIAAIAVKAGKEVAEHLRHSRRWIVCLGNGTGISRSKLKRALNECWDYVGELFLMDDLEKTMVAHGVGCNYSSLYLEWRASICEVASQANVGLPQRAMRIHYGKQGKHSEHLVPLLMEMQYLQRTYPGAQW